jgi:hypothetical protein
MYDLSSGYWFFIFVLACLCGAVSGIIADRRGHSRNGGFWLGFLFGPVGVVVALLQQPNQWELRRRNPAFGQCPACAEYVRNEAIKCRYCGSNLAPVAGLQPGILSGPRRLAPDAVAQGDTRSRS